MVFLCVLYLKCKGCVASADGNSSEGVRSIARRLDALPQHLFIHIKSLHLKAIGVGVISRLNRRPCPRAALTNEPCPFVTSLPTRIKSNHAERWERETEMSIFFLARGVHWKIGDTLRWTRFRFLSMCLSFLYRPPKGKSVYRVAEIVSNLRERERGACSLTKRNWHVGVTRIATADNNCYL